MLDGIDLLVVDLQDVGCRVYTFAWTVSHCLEACADQNIPVLVLDRPNPIGGEAIAGTAQGSGMQRRIPMEVGCMARQV